MGKSREEVIVALAFLEGHRVGWRAGYETGRAVEDGQIDPPADLAAASTPESVPAQLAGPIVARAIREEEIPEEEHSSVRLFMAG